MSSMEEAYRADYAFKKECDEARLILEGILKTERVPPQCRERLERTCSDLRVLSAHVVSAWN